MILGYHTFAQVKHLAKSSERVNVIALLENEGAIVVEEVDNVNMV